MKSIHINIIFIFMSAPLSLWGQNPDNSIAVLDFKPVGIERKQAEKITERLRIQLNKTGAVQQMNRKWIYDVLRREGIKKIKCITPECTADLGNTLDVNYVVTGELIKEGDSTFTIDINMVHVQSRITKKSKRITVEGDLGDIVVELELLAWNMMWLKPPEVLLAKQRLGRHDPDVVAMLKPRTREDALKRAMWFPGMGSIYRGNIVPGCAFMGLELTFIGLAIDSQRKFSDLKPGREDNLKKYRAATIADSIKKYVDILDRIDADMKNENKNLLTYTVSAVGIWALSMAHAYYAKQKKDEFAYFRPVRFTYDPFTKQASINWYFL